MPQPARFEIEAPRAQNATEPISHRAMRFIAFQSIGSWNLLPQQATPAGIQNYRICGEEWIRGGTIRFFFIGLSFREAYRFTELQILHGAKIMYFLFAIRHKLFIFK